MEGLNILGPSLSAACGAMLGAFVGDACGAVLEFCPEAARGHVPPEKVEWALTLPGGGCHCVGPGQITDDSELAICLAQGLATAAPPVMPLEAIAQKYAEWLASGPFDVGLTCQRAFAAGLRAVQLGSDSIAESMASAALDKGSLASQANGALMRVTPLAVWGHRLSADEIARCAFKEASLSHPNPICKKANAAYCIAVAALIRDPGNADGAIQAATHWCERSGGGDVLAWITDAVSLADPPAIAGNGNDGWVRWAFTFAFRHLKMESTYEVAIRDILSRGGDTDTNAAIVGGMTGALQGAHAIPDRLKERVIARNAASPGQQVAEFLFPEQLPGLCRRLYELANCVEVRTAPSHWAAPFCSGNFIDIL